MGFKVCVRTGQKPQISPVRSLPLRNNSERRARLSRAVNSGVDEGFSP